MSTTFSDVMYEMGMEEMHQEEYEQELIDTAIEELKEENIRAYLGKYGDAIEKRIKKCKKEADELLKSKHYGMALVSAVTAIEIIIKYFILRPLFEGILLTGKLAEIVLKRILPGQLVRCCELVPSVAKSWNIPITDLKLSNGKELFDTLKCDILDKRNKFVHKAEKVPKEIPSIAIECIDILMKDVVIPMAKKVGLILPKSGVWHKYSYKTKTDVTVHGDCEPLDPFK